MSARWDQEPMTYNLPTIRDRNWANDQAELAAQLAHSQRVNDALHTQLKEKDRIISVLMDEADDMPIPRKDPGTWAMCIGVVAGSFLLFCTLVGMRVVCPIVAARVMEVLG